MKRLSIFLLLAISLTCLGQGKELDSIRHAIEAHPQKDTTRFRLLIIASDFLYSNPQESKSYVKQALELAQELEFEKGVAESYCSLAYYFLNRTDYPQAIENGLIALRVYEKINYLKGIYGTSNILAGIYTSMKEFKLAEEHMQKMLELGKLDERLIDYGTLYYNVGYVKMKQNQFKEGLDLINKALVIFQEKNEIIWQAQCYFFLASAQQELGKLQESLHHYQNCVRLTKLSNHPYSLGSLTSAHEAIGSVYIKLRRFDKALLHLDTALQCARQIKNQSSIISIYNDLAMLYEKQGKLREALKYERLHKQISDSVFNSEKSQQITEAKAKYETEKKEKEIQLLEQSNKIQTLWRNILIAGLVLILIGFVLVYKLQQFRVKKNLAYLSLQVDLLTSQNDELAKKYQHALIDTTERVAVSQDQKLLRKALDVVENNISDSLFGVEKMAEEMGMSRASLHKKLKSITGFSPSDFIRSIRLKRAANLLRNNADSVAQIGFAVGFEDQSYFSKSFKKQFGVTPSEYSSKTESLV